MKRLRREIQVSPRVQSLLAERTIDGRLPSQPYAKWYGAHWVLASLADIGYPSGDRSLLPLKDQALDWLTSSEYQRLIRRPKKGPVRIHASIDGNAIYYVLALGLADPRLNVLVARLLETQWPDGGWNCDPDATGETSSFHETLIPLRALALHATITDSTASAEAARRAAEVFLTRRLFKQRSTGSTIHPRMVELHYPCYWHYDILACLKALAEVGIIDDPRCADALDLLESKRLPDGGFPAEGCYYRVTSRHSTGRSLVPWGVTSKHRMNEWVSVEALTVLRAAKRLSLEQLA